MKAKLYIHDPKVDTKQISLDLEIDCLNDVGESIKKDLSSEEGSWYKVNNFQEAFNEADAVLILTEWKEYGEIEWGDISERMREPAWVFDSRSIVDVKKVKNAGFKTLESW